MPKELRQIIAMGGGGFSMEPDNPLLDLYILNQSTKPNPKVCFIGTASGDSKNYIERFYRSFQKLSCRPTHLSLFEGKTADIESFILDQDILYVGGGNTRNLLTLWKDWGLDKSIRKAYDQGTVLAGISAGSLCWFEEGVTDSIPGKLSALTCLGWLKGSNCPHYDGESNRRPSYHELIHAGMKTGIAAEDSVALHYKDEVLFDVVTSVKNKKAFIVNKDGETEKTAVFLGDVIKDVSPSSNSVLNFYEALSDQYHLIWNDWPTFSKWQGQVLSDVIQQRTQRKPSETKLLDCTCGIGTQAIGLALQNFHIHGTDLSPKSIAVAKKNAIEHNTSITFGVSDIRELAKNVSEKYDVIISCDNSITHLLTQKDLELACKNIYDTLQIDGIFLASIRDYDQLKQDAPTGTYPKRHQDNSGERLYFQTWDWAEDKSQYDFELFVMQKSGDQWHDPTSVKTTFRALEREEFNRSLRAAGFKKIEWLLGKDNPFYQPIVIASKKV